MEFRIQGVPVGRTTLSAYLSYPCITILLVQGLVARSETIFSLPASLTGVQGATFL